MKNQKFKLSHALLGTLLLLLIETSLLSFMRVPQQAVWVIGLASIIGATINLYAATEVIEEVRSARHMLGFLSILVSVFVLFFAFQYAYLLSIQPTSFPLLASDPTTLVLHSIMVLVFNPIFLPATSAGRVLLTINTIAAMVLVLFILQNIWQFRNRSSGLGPI